MIKTPLRTLTAAFGLLVVGYCAHGATVCRTDSVLTFAESTEAGEMEITFRKCMANELYTFSEVKLDGVTVNSAEHSDNIGPFLTSEYGWAGGNHLSDSGNITAKTVEVNVIVCGEELAQGTTEADNVQITVTNELYLPDGEVFAIETMKYLVVGNSIEVVGSHEFMNAEEATVDRYYGMQSMFVGESEILAPGATQYNEWQPITSGGSDNSIRIRRSEVPRIEVFVEKSENGYQACYMMPQDLGLRDRVSEGDVIFIGNSYGKCYHKLIGNSKVRAGDTVRWHGIYSWFRNPLKDTFREGDAAPEFVYPAYVGGEHAKITLDGGGKATVTTI